MNRAWNKAITIWQPAVVLLVGGLLITALLFLRLGSLIPFASQPEVSARTNASTVQVILKNPINAPYKLTRHFITGYKPSLTTERLLSALVAGASIVLFYRMARHFSGKRAALLGAALYASSSVLLNNARLATPNVMLLLLLALVASGYALRFSRHEARVWLLATFITATALYTPGMLYFIIAGAAWQLVRSKHEKDLPKPATIGACVFIFVALLAPLIFGFIKTPSLWREYLALPAGLPHLLTFVKDVLAVPYSLFVGSPLNPVYRLGHQPILDIFTGVMFLVGGFVVLKRYRLDRLYLFAGILLLGTLFTAVSGNYENSLLLLPFIYLIITAGIGYMLESWKSVFPLNPLAHSLALVVISLAVVISCNFQLRRYFIAWPHNAAVRAAFTHR